jgi:flagellar hook-associated protein 2
MSSTSSVGFTAGGIDVSSIVTGLMDVERAPLRSMQARQGATKAQADAIDTLRSHLDTLRTSAFALNGSKFLRLASSSTNPAVATVSTRTGAAPASLTFTVDRLASAHALRTAISSSSPTDLITSVSRLAVSNTTAALGIRSVSADASTAVGSSTLTVTQASAGAARTGTPVSVPAVIDASNDTLTMVVNGAPLTISLTHGTYTAAGLAAAVQAALTASGADARVALQTNGALRFSTNLEGSASSLQMTGGSALGALGLTADSTAALGTDGVVSVNGVTTTVAQASAGTTVNVANGSGTFALTLSGGLRTGTAKVGTVSTGTGTLADVAAAINRSGTGVGASVVQLSSGQYHLQLSSAVSGTAGSIAIDAASINGGLVENAPASDAQLTIGTGIGAYSVSSSTNDFTTVLQNTTITATAVSSTPVTAVVRPDAAATADAVGQLVDQLNGILGELDSVTKFDSATRTAGLLASNAGVRDAAARIRAAATAIVDTSTIPGNAGITTKRDGTLAFDRSTFLTALQADPALMTKMFGRSGTSGAAVNFVDASDATQPGAHSVQITALATQASTTGPALASLVAGQQVAIRRGSTTAVYTVPTGATSASIVSGLQSAIDGAGLGISVADSGGNLALAARDYGSNASFDLNTSLSGGGAWATVLGTDVTGVVDGVLASGRGTVLTVPDAALSSARGLSVDVTTSATVGTYNVDYQPGVAARLGYTLGQLADKSGSLSSNDYNSRLKDLQQQMDRFTDRMADKEVALRRQWSTIQSTLQALQSQGSWLSQQISGLSR